MSKKRLVVFKIWSQGKTFYETYEITNRDNAEKVGQALVIWYNMTGGNSDGSYRVFEGVEYDKIVTSREEYYETPFKHDRGIYPYEIFRSIEVLDENYHDLLKLKKYWGEKYEIYS